MPEPLSTLATWLEAGSGVVLARIAEQSGSTPREAGAMLIVREDGLTFGTVGGGLLEAAVIERAANLFRGGQAEYFNFNLNSDLAAQSGMVCGGALKLFLARINPGPEAGIFSKLAEGLARGESFLLASMLESGGHTLLDASGRVWGPELPPEIIEKARGMRPGTPVLCEAGAKTWLIELLAPLPELVVAGAGHVGLYTANFAAMSGFKVTVLDDRPEFASPERFFPEVSPRLCDFGSCLEGFALRPDSAVAIITRGHAHDACVLAQALRTRAGYIGMIGSLRKRESVYAHLRNQGFKTEDFARVRCPIGLDIGAQTPQEIGLSIAAELVAWRAGRLSQDHSRLIKPKTN